MNAEILKSEFAMDFFRQYGDGLLKTPWHLVTWLLNRKGLQGEAKAAKRRDILRRFRKSCKADMTKASWENCLLWCLAHKCL